MKDCECPYCEAEIEICHDDGYGYEEGRLHNQPCDNCGKTFVYTTNISYDYDTQKADCLNGAEHKWEPTCTSPKCATRMVCNMCEKRRDPTQEERVQYKIPTWSEEFPEDKSK